RCNPGVYIVGAKTEGYSRRLLDARSDYLASIECFESLRWVGNYYPPCPQPELALGAGRHIDPYFLTVLVQDNIGALQALRENHWSLCRLLKELSS
ncbi:Isopenicillin N synthase-like, Fe(2+) 2OG dioxygenase domain, partial [Dillenia turbinata]